MHRGSAAGRRRRLSAGGTDNGSDAQGSGKAEDESSAEESPKETADTHKGEEKNADKDAPAASVNQPFPEEVVQGGDVNRTDHAAIISKTHLHLKTEAIHSPTLILPQILLALLGKEII